jgi:hypothetical protein
MNLHDLGMKYNTDKAHYHNFCKLYDEHLQKYKNLELNFMEIGVLDGSSLKMWYEYFTRSKIYGVDIYDKSYLNNDRIETIIANQENEIELGNLPKNLDIILDDGGHTMIQQQVTFKIMFNNHLKSEGVYVLEDLHTSNSRYYNSHGSNPKNNTLNLLYDIKSGKIRDKSQYYISNIEFEELCENIYSIDIYEIGEDSITSLIKKK